MSGKVAAILCDPISGLTPKQKIFVENFSKTGNGTRSALAAYDTKAYFTAAAISEENLKKPAVIRALEAEWWRGSWPDSGPCILRLVQIRLTRPQIRSTRQVERGLPHRGRRELPRSI